ncbi:MAG TPA: S4 domain-containing protein, partial [Spirochaetia bacterium]|nr:S4 domain-containing protein [Spirochaetia bacterium]
MMTDIKTGDDERHHCFTVGPGEERLRLDLFLAKKEPGFSRAQIQRAVAAGMVLVNGHPIKAGRRVKAADIVAIRIP